MKAYASAATVAALVGVATAQSAAPTVTTPTSLVVCQPAQFTVSGGTAPYFISILPGGETGATPLENLPEQQAAGSITWNVDIAAGTSITIAVRDSTGALNYSQQVTIQAGSSTSCLGTNSASASGAVGSTTSGASSAASSASSSSAAAASSSRPASSSAASSAASSSRPASSSSAAASSSAAPASSAAASSSAPSASAKNSAAGEVIAQTGLLGAVAAFVMAIVA